MKVKGLNSKHFIKTASPHCVILKEHSMVELMQCKFVNSLKLSGCNNTLPMVLNY